MLRKSPNGKSYFTEFNKDLFILKSLSLLKINSSTYTVFFYKFTKTFRTAISISFIELCWLKLLENLFWLLINKILFLLLIKHFLNFQLLQSKFAKSTAAGHHHTWPYPAGIYLLKVNNRSSRARREICSKLIIKTPERRHWPLASF